MSSPEKLKVKDMIATGDGSCKRCNVSVVYCCMFLYAGMSMWMGGCVNFLRDGLALGKGAALDRVAL